jgi:hypothetical protein
MRSNKLRKQKNLCGFEVSAPLVPWYAQRSGRVWCERAIGNWVMSRPTGACVAEQAYDS